MLWKRVLTSVIAAPLLIVILLLPQGWLTVLVILASIIGLFEFYRAVELNKKPLLCIVGYIAAVFIGIGSMFHTRGNMAIFFGFMMLLFIIMLACHKAVRLEDLAMLIISLIYIPYFLSNVNYIRTLENGQYFVWLVFICAFSTDTFAYTVGKICGRHKLCPAISPKKTVEGAIGGVLGCGLCCLVYGWIMTEFAGLPVSLLRLFLMGVAVGIVSELGDLLASIIKRQYGIKDFGNLLPGHGGILDRCDSIILVAPTIYLVLVNIGILL